MLRLTSKSFWQDSGQSKHPGLGGGFCFRPQEKRAFLKGNMSKNGLLFLDGFGVLKDELLIVEVSSGL